MDTSYIIFQVLLSLLTHIPETNSATLDCMAKNIYFEARDQSLEGQIAVAQVVMNRVLSDKYPDSPCKVIYQKNQFSWYWDGKSDRPREKEEFNLAKVIAWAVIQKVVPNIVPESLHYHSIDILPYWAKGKIPEIIIEDHVFYSDL